MDDQISPPQLKSWSIHTRTEITHRYQILERIGSGAYSDVYKARRLSDNLIVALKEIHDYQSAFREIESLQLLQNNPNIVNLIEYFWREDEDAVIVLEYLRTDLASLIREAKRDWEEGIGVGEVKRWMVQILNGVDACHKNSIVHRDLKPANLLISDDGVLKLADFGQARILLDPIIVAGDDAINDENGPDQQEISSDRKTTIAEESGNQDQRTIGREEYSKVNNFKSKELFDGTYKSTNLYDRDTSCLATCTTSDRDDDILKGSTCSYKGSSYSFDAGEENVEDGTGSLTSCVGTRWYRAPELLYGSTDYAQEIDLWSLGCIFAELISLDPLFPGNSDIDQLSRIINVLGNFNEETWPGCSKLPDYGKMFFGEIESPLGLQSRLPNRSSDEVKLIQRLVCYNPSSRATALDLPSDRYFSENPLPVSVSELRVPSTNSDGNERSPREEWFDDSGSDLEEFGGNNVDVRTTDTGFSIRFSP